MKKEIEIGKSCGKPVRIDMPTLLKSRLLLQAGSGGGKSRTLRRIAEQAFGTVPIHVLDPEGEFATLREKYGYVLVGEGGDAAADPRSARLLAERLLELNASVVVDLFEAFRSRPMDRRLFVANYLDALMDAPRKLWRDTIIIVDEAHKFAPQENPKAASMQDRETISRCKDAMIALATAGRKRGFCAIWATQRLAKLDKDASAELLNRMVGMTVEDVDLDRAVDLMSVSRADQHEFKESLRNLEPGNFYAFGRAISKSRILVMVGGVQTTHPESGALAQSGPPPMPEKIRHLLPKLADLPQAAADQTKNESNLRAEVKRLQAELARTKAAAPRHVQEAKVTERVVEKPVVLSKDVLQFEKATGTLSTLASKVIDAAHKIRGDADSLRERLERLERNLKCTPVTRTREAPPLRRVPAETRPTQVPQGAQTKEDLQKAERIVLGVLAQHPDGCDIGKLALLSVYKVSGGFRNILGGLRSKDLIEGGNTSTMRITDAGLLAVTDGYDALPMGEELVEYWLRHRAFGGAERKVIGILRSHPDGLSIEDLAAASGYQVSGGFRNVLGKLRTAGVLVGKNTEVMRLADEMQPQAAG